MAKNRGSPLTGREAETIAKKLGAEIDKSGPHIRAVIRHEGYVLATFGWCHDRKKGNGNIPKDLGLSGRLMLDMARCHYNKDDYLRWLRDKGELPN